MVFLGYSTSTSGAFSIDGDFGRGTNRGVAQFQFEHGLTNRVTRETLCYPCRFSNARKRIIEIPTVRLDMATLNKMLKTAQAAIDQNQVTFGSFRDALFHLNALHRRGFLSCLEIEERFGRLADEAALVVGEEKNIRIQPEWVLAIIKQETSGIVRPRFEQHKLSRFGADEPETDLAELRHRSMSIGLGQIMGFNYKSVGAASARAMLYSPAHEQVVYVARFIARKKDVVRKISPDISDFRAMARSYNGPSYETHFYHEKLQRWFREFRLIRDS
jgi:hypothetical protein